jgi:hypothetical protein
MKLLQFVSLLLVGHILIWIQSNGQLMWSSFRNNVFFVCLFGIPLSYMFINATRIGYGVFENELWPVRVIGFSIGTIVFTFMTYLFLGEAITAKTLICILLSVVIILVQVLM